MNLTKSRAQDVALMILAIAIVLIGVPVGIYFAQTWAENIPVNWDEVSGGDLFSGDLLTEPAESEYIWSPHSLDNGSVIYLWAFESRVGLGWPTHWTYTDHAVYNNSATAWDLDGNGTNAVILDDNLTSEVPGELVQTYWSRVYWIIDLNASTISDSDIWSFKFNVNYTGNYTWTLALAKTTITNEVDITEIEVLGSGTGSDKEQGVVEYDLLDVVGKKTALGEGKMVFYIQKDEEPFALGDTVLFQFWVQGKSSGLLSQKNITNVVILVITGILGFMALASTPLWNPLNPRNPGIVGRVGGRITSWIGRRSRRRRYR